VAAEQARLEAVFEAATDALVAVAEDTTVRYMNPAAERLFETDRAHSRDRRLIEMARDYEIDTLVRNVVETSNGPRTSVITFGQDRVPLRAAAVPIEDGGNWAVLLILTDLTEVARVDQVRRDFVSNVSHEL